MLGIGGGGQMVSVLAENPSLNPAEVYSFYSVPILFEKNNKRPGMAHLKMYFNTYEMRGRACCSTVPGPTSCCRGLDKKKIIYKQGQCDQIGQHFKSLGQLFQSLLIIWQNVEPYLDILNAIGRIFIVTNGRILKNNIDIWSH